MEGRWAKLYKSPRWFKKRDIILERDNHQCTVCKSKIKLHVHHTFYYKGDVPPWKYPNESLITLCFKCHQDWHEHSELIYKELPKQKYKGKFKKKKPRSLAQKVEDIKKEKERKKKYVKVKNVWYKL
jgi:5-methylcytosine-specific restriction endonuclease McrA